MSNQIAWLIECGIWNEFPPPITYFCGDGDWCSNPNHAFKFSTEQEALSKLESMKPFNPENYRVAEHMWIY